ncbi:MAG: efflux RND transporter periplasmic adaptor subunit, partial [Candidatus Tectomicrobia bacterium]|nr:efflux RND transporter periplasmic adaptor subunit [Candidatus Tectomicrobia bacterium]
MRKRGNRGHYAVGYITLIVALSWWVPAAAQRNRPAVVEVAPVVQETIAQPVTFVGTVEPRRRSRVASEVEGIVEQVYVEEGQPVSQGDPLLKLRPHRLRLILEARQATAKRYQEELAELKNGSRPEEIAEARAAVQEAEAELAQARREKSRQLGLSERGVSSLQSREDAETNFNVTLKRLTRARKRYELVARGARAERIAQAEAQYQAARAEVEQTHYDLSRSQVEAPFEGFVVAKHTEIGQWLGEGDPIVTLIELTTARITVPVPERYVAQVQLGATGLVQLDAFPGKTWQGAVVSIIPQATESRTFPVVVEVPNPDAVIKSGAFARVTLTVG